MCRQDHRFIDILRYGVPKRIRLFCERKCSYRNVISTGQPDDALEAAADRVALQVSRNKAYSDTLTVPTISLTAMRRFVRKRRTSTKIHVLQFDH